MEINVEELWLTMVTFNQCCICRTRDELRNALFYRHYPFCEVAVLSNAEEAHCYTQQRYHANFFANPYLYGYPTMPLPNTANNTPIFLKSTSPLTSVKIKPRKTICRPFLILCRIFRFSIQSPCRKRT